MRNLILLIAILVLHGCSWNGRENLKATLQYISGSDSRILWTEDQNIKFEYFEGEDCENVQNGSPYFGLMCLFINDEEMKFEVTAFFDKSQSCVLPKENWNKPNIYKYTEEFTTIKFDFYEYGARKFRKFLINEGTEKTYEEIRKINAEFHKNLTDEWVTLTSPDSFQWSDSGISELRNKVDQLLFQFSEYSSAVNNY